MENQRFFLYIALAFVLYMIWLTWQQEHMVAPEIKPGQEQAGLEADPLDLPESTNTEDLPEISSSEATSADAPVTQVNNSVAKSEKITVKTDVLNLIIDTRGGDVRQVDLPTYPVSLKEKDKPFRLMYSGQRTYIAQSGLQHDKINGQRVSNKLAPTHHDVYRAEQTFYELEKGQDSLEVRLNWSGDNGIEVEKVFTFYRDSFVFDVKHSVVNNSDSIWVGRQYNQLRRSPVPEDTGWLRLPTYTGTAYFNGKYEKHSFGDVEDEPIKLNVQGGWVAMLQHYFVSAWVPEAESENTFYSKTVESTGQKQYLIGMKSAAKTIAPNSSADFTRRFFTGPKLQHRMEKIAKGLDLSVDYGMFSILSKPLFWLLEWFHKLVGNWGVAIILVTVVIKLAFFKLSASSYKSMARMRKVQPRFQALRERYADDKQKLNQAVMEMYRKEKINPIGGCLPILVQMPVFLALYWVLVESVELRQAPFMLWIQDLAIRDPIFVLPFLMGISMFVQFKLNPTPPDPMQARIFALMPIMMTIFMAFFPAGLVLYWLMNNILSIAQQYVITKRIENAA